jgi:hypothetical protein
MPTFHRNTMSSRPIRVQMTPPRVTPNIRTTDQSRRSMIVAFAMPPPSHIVCRP